MLDLARHIVNQKADRFDPEKFEDHHETALKPAATNVVDLMEALRRSVGQEAPPAKAGKPAKKPRSGEGRKSRMDNGLSEPRGCWSPSRPEPEV